MHIGDIDCKMYIYIYLHKIMSRHHSNHIHSNQDMEHSYSGIRWREDRRGKGVGLVRIRQVVLVIGAVLSQVLEHCMYAETTKRSLDHAIHNQIHWLKILRHARRKKENHPACVQEGFLNLKQMPSTQAKVEHPSTSVDISNRSAS
jgi:hypothetical protein